MAGLYIFAGKNADATRVGTADVARWLNIKRRHESDHHVTPTTIVSLVGSHKHPKVQIARTPNGDWLCAAGAWVHIAGIRYPDSEALLARYLDVGATALAKELDGTFTLVIGDARSGKTIVMTDPRGSLHVYLREDEAGVAVCTSSMALSQDARLDPIGAYEFIATGILYESRSLWAGVQKIPPATILEIEGGRVSQSSTYWSFTEALAQPLRLDDAADALVAAMTQTLKTIGTNHSPVIADLTGGYDSRLLLLGLFESGIRFDNTVVGPADSPDVLTARKIADRLKLSLTALQEPAALDAASFDAALRLCDGEYNAFDYANIMRNQAPFVANHGASLNGSFGEVARGYWWELLWPKLDAHVPLDADMLARKRFAAVPFTEVFAKPPVDSLATHLAGVVRRTIDPVKDLPLASQMDHVYLAMRMQRWQGRIASNTNQIWPALAPLGFTATLTPMLAAQPATRFRSLLPRYVFSKRHPVLADIALEHGFPPTVANMANLHRFAPLLGHYGHKVLDKLANKLRHNTPTAVSLTAAQRYPDLFQANLADCLAAPRLLASGLFNESVLQTLLDPAKPIGGQKLVQWQRLITLECSLLAHATACRDLNDARQ